MKAQSHQSRTVNPYLFKCMYSSCTYIAICVAGVCVWVDGCGGVGGGDLRPYSPVVWVWYGVRAMSYSKARISQTTL